MAESKSSETKPAAAKKAAPTQQGDFADRGLSFAVPGQPEPDLHVATWGDEGDDPLEAGFVGVKPKDEQQ